MAACQIMAEKQVAASAIQGKFSVDGLASMAKGVDPRVKLATMLSENDMGEGRKSLENMFDVMNKSNEDSSDDAYSDYVEAKTFYEIMEGEDAYFEKAEGLVKASDSKPVVKKAPVKTIVPVNTEHVEVDLFATQGSIFDMFSMFDDVKETKEEPKAEVKKAVAKEITKTPKKEKKIQQVTQISLFDMFAA
jgi:hypothetical protein